MFGGVGKRSAVRSLQYHCQCLDTQATRVSSARPSHGKGPVGTRKRSRRLSGPVQKGLCTRGPDPIFMRRRLSAARYSEHAVRPWLAKGWSPVSHWAAQLSLLSLYLHLYWCVQ